MVTGFIIGLRDPLGRIELDEPTAKYWLAQASWRSKFRLKLVKSESRNPRMQCISCNRLNRTRCKLGLPVQQVGAGTSALPETPYV